ncbi:MAG: MFS transporter [Clostridiales Family XIII bacterium]|jgi:OFA family oxalate/formate antiporter-like MFS transporter|nr:MFS transporter [Clostridiales Family XIII bacterium]
MQKQGNKVTLLAVGTVMLLFLGLIYAWSIFRAPLGELFDWTTTQMSMTFTLSMVFFCLGGFVAGKLAERLNRRTIIWLSAAFVLVGFLLIGLLLDPGKPGASLALLYVCYGVLVGSGVGFSYNTLLGVIARWWVGKTGMASGILLLGFGVGSLVLGFLVEALNAAYGLNTTFLVLGVLLAAILFAGSVFVRMPEAAGAAAAGAGGAAPAADEPRSYTLGEAARFPAFWIMFVWILLLCINGMTVINSAAPIAKEAGVAGVIGLIFGIFNGAGRPILGTVMDRFGRRTAMTLNAVIMLAGSVILLAGGLTTSAPLILIALPIIGIAYGGTPALEAASVNKFFGPRHYQVIFGVVTFALAVAAIIGPLVSSKLQESSGSYVSSFVMLVILAAASIGLGFLLNASAKKSGLE